MFFAQFAHEINTQPINQTALLVHEQINIYCKCLKYKKLSVTWSLKAGFSSLIITKLNKECKECTKQHDQHDCTNYEGKIFHVARHIWSRVPYTDKMSPQRVLNTHSSGKRCWTQFFVEFSQFSENLPYLRLGCSQLARWCSLAGRNKYRLNTENAGYMSVIELRSRRLRGRITDLYPKIEVYNLRYNFWGGFPTRFFRL